MTARCLLLPMLLLPAFNACAKAKPAEAPPGIEPRVRLARAASCDSLTRSVQDTAVRQMRWQLESQQVVAPMGAPGPAAAGPAAAAPASYSTTNTQVAGVDEADFVKNDGTRIFVLSGRTLYAAKSWPPQDLALAGKLDLEGWPSSMFLDGNRVVVFSSVQSVAAATDSAAPPCGVVDRICSAWAATTKITVVDVSDLAAPQVRSEMYLPGYATGARRAESSVRLVLADQVRWPETIRWWPDYRPGLYQDKDKLAAAIAALEDANEAIIRKTPLEKWFPPGQRRLQGGALVDVGYQCGDFYLSNAPERLGLLTVATLDLATPDAVVSRSSIVAEPGIIYASKDRLYLASEHWWWWRLAGQRDFTYLHAFDLADPARAGYLGSGGVEGHLGDQFAMDEQDGYLRVATSESSWQEDAHPGTFRALVSSRLSVLGPQADGSLKLVGEIAPLAEGERVMAARFTGRAGYAVTFRSIDPLLTLDLADPAHPKKVAELTLPGFSTYLQPVDERHLLAIGEDLALDASGHPDWSRRAVQLSLFDVSDLAHPVRSAQALVGTASGYSEALWDHRAFNWYRPDPAKPGLLAIPFSDWQQPGPSLRTWDGFVSDVRLFQVDPAGSIVPAGALGMSDVYIRQGTWDFTYWYRPWVRRSVLATDQGGSSFVYAVSDAGVRAAALSNLTAPLGTTLFTH